LKRAVNRATVGNLHHSLPLIGVKGTEDFNLPLDLIQYRRSRAGTAAEPTAAAATAVTISITRQARFMERRRSGALHFFRKDM